MAKRVAPAKNTGGGGFAFEDEVCAWLLACTLVGEPAFGQALGVPDRLDFQTSASGWLLDDILVTTQSGTVRRRVALSVKSNKQLTARRAPPDFVKAIWEQWMHIGSDAFDASSDFMGLLTTPLPGAARASVDGLLAKTNDADPKRFPDMLSKSGWANKQERELFASFLCPPTLWGERDDRAVETTRLLKRLLFPERDFGGQPPRSENEAIELCRRALRTGEREDAKKLWHALRVRATKLRPTGGHMTRAELVDELRGGFSLASYPDYAADWGALDRQSQEAARAVPNAIAGRVELPRDVEVAKLLVALETSECVAVVGPSGVGKSVVCRALLEARAGDGQRTLWFGAEAFETSDFTMLEAALGIRHPLSELLPVEEGRDRLIILDGLERLYSPHAVRNAVRVLLLARRPAPAARWRVVIPCQAPEWPRVQEAIEREGLMAAWVQVEIDAPTRGDLASVSDAMPALARLFLQPRILAVLANLKILDLIARRVVSGAAVDSESWVGESSVAEWYWGAEIDRGANRIARGVFVRQLAQQQGDRLLASVPLDSLDVDLAPLESLDRDRICVESGGRLAFGHDLLGDWVRLRILLEKRADLAEFLRDRRDLPLWHRALRLYGIHLLEHQNGVAEWREAIATLGGGQPGAVHDLLLEAPVFAVDAGPLLDGVLADLVANEGALLRRLLNRFLLFATMPDQNALANARLLGVDLGLARAQHRVPYWPYWLDVLRFLHRHRATLVPLGSAQIASVVDMWQVLTRRKRLLRRETGEIALLLGQRALATRGDWSARDPDDERQRLYRCALAAADEFPDEVAALARRAAERSPAQAMGPDAGRRRRRRPSFFPAPSTPVPPWPDGPWTDVDPAFRSAVLEPAVVSELVEARPAIAREIVLATLIDPPDEEGHPDPLRGNDLELASLDDWQPATYARGPFLLFLRANFAEGLELIVRLVDFATSRWRERARGNERDLQAVGRGTRRQSGLLVIYDADEIVVPTKPQPKAFSGGEHAYLWSSGNGNAPLVVQAALMSLEQYLYEQIERGEDIAAKVEAVLARGTSVALLSVLCVVGKRHEALFEGPLRPLLATPELYAWDINIGIHAQLGVGIRPSQRSAWMAQIAHAFSALPHRTVRLRDVLMRQTIRSADMRKYFAEVVEGWQSAADGGDGRIEEMRRQVKAIVTPENYEVREHPEHGPCLVNAEEERVFESRADERRVYEDNALLMVFPHRCRKVLDEESVLSETDREVMWKDWQRLRALAQRAEGQSESGERFGDEFANAIVGGVAVFLSQPSAAADDWPQRDEVLSALRAVLRTPPRRSPLDNWDSVSTSSWDTFAADALVTLWVRDPTNSEWRSDVATGVFAPHFAALRQLFARCARHREALGADFSRLRHLAVEWAYVWDRVDLLRHVPPEALQLGEGGRERAEAAIDSWVTERVDSFAAGSMGILPADWDECRERERFAELDAAGGRWTRADMNFTIVRCAHAWLPMPNEARDEAERVEWIRFWRTALVRTLKRPQAFTSRSERHYPDDNERWVLQATALLVLQLRESEQPDLFWQPILDLVDEANDWSEIFLRALHREALEAQSVPATYVPLLRRLVRHAFLKDAGKRRWRSYESVWDALLAMDGYSRDLWEPRHRPVVLQLGDVWDHWTQQVVPTGRRLAYFAQWLRRPAAEPLRLSSLPWLLDCLGRHEKWRAEEVTEAANALAGLLDFVWQNDEARLRANAPAFDAFRKVLAWHCDRQNPRALELLGRIGGFG